MRLFWEKLRKSCQRELKKAENKTRHISQDVTDPFVDVRLGNARIAKTSVIDNDLNPVWNEKFRIEVCRQSQRH